MLPGQEWDGNEKRENPHRYRKIHPWRWRALTVWIIIFSLVVAYSIRQVDETAAKIEDLEITNCNTKVFLLTAAQRNIVAAETPDVTPDEKAANRRAANTYIRLANNFTAVGVCLPAQRLTKQLEEGG